MLSEPTKVSPIKRSPVFPVELLIEVKVTLGKAGLSVSLDSNTACTLRTSGTFNEISSSWTLVP